MRQQLVASILAIGVAMGAAPAWSQTGVINYEDISQRKTRSTEREDRRVLEEQHRVGAACGHLAVGRPRGVPPGAGRRAVAEDGEERNKPAEERYSQDEATASSQFAAALPEGRSGGRGGRRESRLGRAAHRPATVCTTSTSWASFTSSRRRGGSASR